MSKNLTTQYISRRLAEARMDAFDADEFARLFRLAPARAYRVLHRLASAGALKRLANGRHCLPPGEAPADALLRVHPGAREGRGVPHRGAGEGVRGQSLPPRARGWHGTRGLRPRGGRGFPGPGPPTSLSP